MTATMEQMQDISMEEIDAAILWANKQSVKCHGITYQILSYHNRENDFVEAVANPLNGQHANDACRMIDLYRSNPESVCAILEACVRDYRQSIERGF